MKRCPFESMVFRLIFIQHHIHEQIFNIFSTTLHPYYFQFNFYLIIELYLVQLNSIEFK
jgi:hypothetical protein